MLAIVMGMTCSHCSTTVENAVLKIAGVIGVKVDLTKNFASIELLPSIDHQKFSKELINCINELGFEVKGILEDRCLNESCLPQDPIKFKITDMSCEQCATWVRNSLADVFGTDHCVVDLEEGSCSINTPLIDRNQIQSQVSAAVSKAGFTSLPWGGANTTPSSLSFAMLNQDSTVTLTIGGMSCASCSNRIETSLKSLPGVIDAYVNFLTGKATVALSAASELLEMGLDGLSPPSQSTTSSLIQVVEALGYTASPLITSSVDSIVCVLNVCGLVCDNCPSRIEKLLSVFGGVSQVATQRNSEPFNQNAKVIIRFDGRTPHVGPRAFIQCLTDAGYEASLCSDQEYSENQMDKETRRALKLLLWGLLFTIPLVIIMMALPLAGVDEVKFDLLPGEKRSLPIHALVGIILSTPVQFGVGYGFYVRAYEALRKGGTNMDVLIALGTSVAYFYSAVIVVTGFLGLGKHYTHYYFETSAILITFVALGKYLEAVTKQGTGSAVKALLELEPDEACIVEGDAEVQVRLSTVFLQRGDIVLVKAGERIPCDGLLTKILGQGVSMDESMLTGEAMPVTKSIGDEVLAGTVNMSGPIYLEATKVGSASTLQGIIRLVERAQSSKAPIQFYADYISSKFVPFVVLTAVLTIAGWAIGIASGSVPRHWYREEGPAVFCLLFGVSVLVIACPCALGLAVPTAVMVGSGVGASLGVLIKGGSALETTHSVQVVVFDKTGTLTHGKPTVTSVEVFEHPDGLFPVPLNSKEKLLLIAGSCEAPSEHPLAQAITTAASHLSGNLYEVDTFESQVGSGVYCRLKDTWSHVAVIRSTEEQIDLHPLEVFIGSRSYVQNVGEGCELTEDQNVKATSLEEEGQTIVFVLLRLGCHQHLAGFIAIADSLRQEAKETVAQLHSMNIEVWMASGDNRRTALAIARKVGIIHVLAEVKPEGKADKVRQLKRGNKVVAMVGDGINDSPAIAEADVGIAIGAGSDVTIQAAAVVLMRSDLRGVLVAIHLSRYVFRRIQVNMAFSLGYNTLGIPIAAGCFYPLLKARMPPEVAGLAMALSSVSVVLSSLHLKRYKPPSLYQSA